MASEGKTAKKVVKDKERKKTKGGSDTEAKIEKKPKEKTERVIETVAVKEVAEVTEPLEVVETEEVEREAGVEEVGAKEIEQELRELKPKGAVKIVVGPPRITRFEKARIIGARALQLSLGAPPLVPPTPSITDSIGLAQYELEKVLPISLRRVLPNGQYQDIPIRWLFEPQSSSK